ncbi:Thioredoxin-like 3-2, chloroplastic [Stylosanthes scabra]|uniref:Thioredoxin-like 3-2, chloroplastic n=1 Tax=Stylosanthes scabra TaxID=79078 RepID=A0ABU6Y317_9FABA|nr:Thioredoxin-like 3-2, chloroplastic [Stylosanthes scabra]
MSHTLPILRYNNNNLFSSLFAAASTTTLHYSSPLSISFKPQKPLLFLLLHLLPSPSPSPLNALPQRQEQHHQLGGDSPLSIELTPISTDNQFDQLLHHSHHPLIIVWVANWCRKCIYLKPKLEKLAAEYYPRLHFYTVDVNTVSHKLVARAGVTKMPTIQLWKDGKKQGEVIGGHNAYWVIGDVQEMIENECNT